eukprot:Hpha_TRINITY_DN6805_c0_g1::TRINITY_DN6805_c0_g1_i1::g.46111::m.46111
MPPLQRSATLARVRSPEKPAVQRRRSEGALRDDSDRKETPPTSPRKTMSSGVLAAVRRLSGVGISADEEAEAGMTASGSRPRPSPNREPGNSSEETRLQPPMQLEPVKRETSEATLVQRESSDPFFHAASATVKVGSPISAVSVRTEGVSMTFNTEQAIPVSVITSELSQGPGHRDSSSVESATNRTERVTAFGDTQELAEKSGTGRVRILDPAPAESAQPPERVEQLESENARLRSALTISEEAQKSAELAVRELTALVKGRCGPAPDDRTRELEAELTRVRENQRELQQQVADLTAGRDRQRELEQQVAELTAVREREQSEERVSVLESLRIALAAAEAARAEAIAERDTATTAFMKQEAVRGRLELKLQKAEETLVLIAQASVPQAIRASSPPALGLVPAEPVTAFNQAVRSAIHIQDGPPRECGPRHTYRLPHSSPRPTRGH